ncbi:MAG: hypothetical protein QOA14_08885 [Nitrososphaeraceae archaeon]|nr:hypothetical protein [Nitrososphaeraceae archaeon]MDW0170896.1 hypothetical protein [Nitrososphaeraceae archaeon]MDW0173696.1 hypothetical protein [Nitrososphaeraceae archaeon]MDW0175599.1 hypothetical protein [Nitrososphaeraceae archaeon]MDW0180510.1 hypothetical protein [Nitrososphaeraceae archaeon]
MSLEIPVQYTHSIKVEDTAKGIRIDVHVYAKQLVISIDLYACTDAFQTCIMYSDVNGTVV